VRAKLKSYIGAASFDNALYADDARLGRLLRNGMAYFELASHAPLESLPGRSAHASDENRGTGETYNCCKAGQGGFARRAQYQNGGSGFMRTPRNDPTFTASLPSFVQHLQLEGLVEKSGTFGSTTEETDSKDAEDANVAREMFMLNQVEFLHKE